MTSESVYSDVKMELLDEDDPSKGLKVILPHGDLYHKNDGDIPTPPA